MPELVSIIVPVYNVRKYLDRSLASIISQTYENSEIILVNDGSTDGSDKVCERFAEKHRDIVKYISQQNAGLSSARNAGLDIAKGDYITFVDSDDTIEPDLVESMVNIASAHKSDMIISKFGKPKGSGEVTDIAPEEALEMVLNQTSPFTHSACGKLYSAHLFYNNRNRFTKGIIYEDLDFFPRIIKDCSLVTYYDKLLYNYYTERPESITNNPKLLRTDVLEITEQIQNAFSDNKNLHRAAINRRFAANYNIFFLSHDIEICNSCWKVIKNYRLNVLFNKKARLKNRIGALVSFIGPRLLKAIF